MPLQERAERYMSRFGPTISKDVYGEFNFGDSNFTNNFKYAEINFPRYSYYIGIKDSTEVEYLYTRGLPFARSFKKAIKKKFSDCPSIIKKVESKEFTKEDIIMLVYYYNVKCLE